MQRCKNKADRLFYLVPALMTVNGVLSFGGFFRLSDIVLISLYFLFFVKFGSSKLNVNGYFLLSVSIFWFVTSTVSTVFYAQPNFEIARDIRFWTTLLWIPIYILYKGKQKIDIQIPITLGACIMSTTSILVYLMDNKLHRIAGFFSSAGGNGLGRQASYNEWGAVFSIAFCVSLYLFVIGNKRSHVFFMIIILTGLLLTQSRSGILATVVGSVTIITYKIYLDIVNRNLNRSSSLLALTAILLPQLYLWISPKLALNRINESFEFGSNAFVSANDRFYMWSQAITIWSDQFFNILFGVGQASFEKAMRGATSDSFYLDHLAIFGLFSLITYALYMAICIYLSKNRVFSLAIFLVGVTFSLTGNVVADPVVGAVFLLSLLVPGVRGLDNET